MMLRHVSSPSRKKMMMTDDTEFLSLEEKDQEGESPNWRAEVLRRKFEERRIKALNPHKTLLETGKRHLFERKKVKAYQAKFQEAAQEYDGTTQLALSTQNHRQAVMLHRSEQSWDINKQLRSIKTTVRRAAEGKKESINTLDALEQKIQDLRELAVATTAETEEEDDMQRMAMAQIRRGQNRNRLFADAEVDAELAVLGSEDNSAFCPKCEHLFLHDYLEEHVKTCKPRDFHVMHQQKLQDAKGIEFQEMAQNARKQAALQLNRTLEKRQSSFLASTEVCPECGKKVLKSRMKAHEIKCRDAQKALLQIGEQREALAKKAAEERGVLDESERLGHMLSLPPQNIRLLSVTSTSIELAWDPPVFMGGYNVFVYDYVVEYSLCSRTRVGKRQTVSVLPQKPVSTSRFCMRMPVCSEYKFALDGLKANTEYCNLRLRALNHLGPSDPSEEIETVTTDFACPPSPPQQLMLARASSSMLTFCWGAPVNDGGAATGVLYYELEYSMLTHKSLRVGSVMTTEKVKIEIPCQCYVLDGLEGDFSVRGISVIAVSEDAEKRPLYSKKSNVLDHVKTLEPTKEEVLRKEIRRVSMMKEKHVDSKAYAGFTQRYTKTDLVNRLSRDLKKLTTGTKRRTKAGEIVEYKPKKEVTKVYEAFPLELLISCFGYNSRRVSVTTMQRKRDKERDARRATMIEANVAIGMGEIPRRRAQYEYRINRLEMELEQLQSRRGELVMKRASRTKELEQEEQRLSVLVAEHDRVTAHTGEYIDSSVIHDRTQRFQTWSLKGALEEELRHGKLRLSEGKQLQVNVNSLINRTKERTAYKEKLLKERRAALVSFENEIARKQRALNKVRHWRLKGVAEVFKKWAEEVQNTKRVKQGSKRFIMRMKNLELYKAFGKWVEYLDILDIQEMKKLGITGAGTYLLASVKDDRKEIQGSAAEVLYKVRACIDNLEERSRTNSQIKAIESSVFYDEKTVKDIQYEREHPELFAQATLNLKQAKAYLSQGEYETALEKFFGHIDFVSKHKPKFPKHQLKTLFSEEEIEKMKLQEGRDLRQLTDCYYGVAQCFQRMGKIDKAIVNYERTKSLAVESNSDLLQGLSLLGMSQCHRVDGFYKTSIEYADRAIVFFEDLKDRRNLSRAYEELSLSYKGMFDEERYECFAEKARKLKYELEEKIHDTLESIEQAEKKLISITADRSTELKLEVVSNKVPDLRIQIEEKRTAAEGILSEAKRYGKANFIDSKRLGVVKTQIEKVKKCKEEELDSDLVHGIMQRFKVKQLLQNLMEEEERLVKVIEERKTEKKKAEIRASNVTDDMQGLEEILMVELGALMRKITMDKQRFRCAGLNPVNLKSRDVSGLATGGIERTIMTVKNSVYVFDLRDGALLRILDGSKKAVDVRRLLFNREKEEDPELREANFPIPGHFGSITATFYHDRNIITGGVDQCIRVWKDRDDFRCTMLLAGHTGTVWSLWADNLKIISGSSDKSIRIWGLRKGTCLRVIHNVHNRAVKCIDCDIDAMVTGSPDYEVRVWPHAIDFSSKKVVPKHKMKRFIGHDCPITCVRLSGRELISGGEDGKILIWDVITGAVVTTCLGHTGPVRGLQADATKVVSCGLDKNVCVFDAATGLKLLTLRGHEDAVLSVQFDQFRILSVSSDGVLRYWYWSGDRQERLPCYDKLHILKEGETLASISDEFGSPVGKLLSWNNIQDPSKTMYVGMRLIVQKGGVDGGDGADGNGNVNGGGEKGASSR